MIITENFEIAQKFTDLMLTAYSSENIKGRSGIHRSSIIDCPLTLYYTETGEAEQHFDENNVGIWLLGELCHIAFTKYFDAREKVFNLAGIKVTIDAIYNSKFPVELKTTRKKIYRREDLLNDWIHQLSIGMAVMESDVGYLIVMNIITFKLQVYEFHTTKEEREKILEHSLWTIIDISNAIKERNPNLLKPKYEKCKTCSFRPIKGVDKKNCLFYRILN